MHKGGVKEYLGINLSVVGELARCFFGFLAKKMWALQNFPCPLIHVIDLSSWKEYCRENSKDAKVPETQLCT